MTRRVITLDPLMTFAQAERFLKADAHLRCSNQDIRVQTVVPSVVLSAFASELYLKCLICLSGGRPGVTHRLDKLFDNLKQVKPAAATRVNQLWDQIESREENVALQALVRQHTGHTGPADLAAALAESASAFEKLRYINEVPIEMSNFSLIHLPQALRSVALEEKPEWAKYSLFPVGDIVK
jgi:HEPN domain-containing protein